MTASVAWQPQRGQCVTVLVRPTPVPCASAHNSRVTGVVRFEGSNYPGASALSRKALGPGGCEVDTDFVFYPSPWSWSQGDRQAVCVAELETWAHWHSGGGPLWAWIGGALLFGTGMLIAAAVQFNRVHPATLDRLRNRR